MRVLIIEDETMAAQTLRKLIEEVCDAAEIIGQLESIEDSVEWFSTHPMPDLVFMDIHLADGSSFAIFEKAEITCPVIFTTAYDEYALKAFEVNSIDYLLKPINKKDLERAMGKYCSLVLSSPQANGRFDTLLKQMGGRQKKYRNYFLIPERDKLIPLLSSNIAYIYIDTKTVKAVSLEGKSFYMNHPLDELMAQLDPAIFFRANRQFIISRHAVQDISIWFGSKLSVNLTIETPEKIIISKARVSEFKNWFVD